MIGFRLILWIIGAVGMGVAGLLLAPSTLPAQHPQIAWSEQEKPIVQALHGLRSLPDDARARETRQLALDIRALAAGDHKLTLANGLANLSTEGDFGHDALQEVAATLAAALTEHPVRKSVASLPSHTLNWRNWCATSTCKPPWIHPRWGRRSRNWRQTTRNGSRRILP
jgi:hypothetical protein